MSIYPYRLCRIYVLILIKPLTENWRTVYIEIDHTQEKIIVMRMNGTKTAGMLLLLFLSVALSTTAQQSSAPGGSTVSATSGSTADQEGPIRGTVKDVNGTGLIGVTIRVKGTSTGTTSGPDGTFTLNLPAGKDTLVFSYLGYVSQEVKAGTAPVNVVLQSSESQLEQVVVVGYGTQRKRDLTGSISSVKGEDLLTQPVQTATQAAQGRIAGVQVISSGQPNSQPQIRVRGTGSVLAGANPLYVVDGVLTDDIRNIATADILTMDVLKDASAAIYGVRAANGVIIITTRKGKAGAPKVRYDANVGFREAASLVEMADRDQYISYLADAAPGKDALNNPYVFGGTTNWYSDVLRKAFQQNHNISVSGGSEKSTYYLSGGYISEDGIVQTNNFKRFTFRANNDISITDHIRFMSMISYSRASSRDVELGDTYRNVYRAAPIVQSKVGDRYGNTSGWANVGNPLVGIDKRNDGRQESRFQGNAALEITPVSFLKFRSAFNADIKFGNDRIYAYQYLNDDKTFLVAGGNQQNQQSRLTREEYRSQGWILDNTITFDKTFDKHSLTLLAGSVTEGFYSTSLKGVRINVPAIEDLWYLDLGDPNVQSTLSNVGDKYARQSFVGRVNYGYDGRYLLSASIRADGSSKFSDRWGYFPTVGLGWVLSEEGFIKDKGIFDFLKLRGSWGRLGNDNIPTNAYIAVTAIDAPYVFGGAPLIGGALKEIKDPFLKWEATTQYDIGVEFALLKNKLSGEVDYYSKKTTDALVIVNTPAILGDQDNSYITNAASFKNQGWEITLNWKDKITDDLSYNVGGNITFNTNELTGLNGGQALLGGNVGQQSFVTRTDNGHAVGSFYVRDALGVFQNQAEINAYTTPDGKVIQPNAAPGDLKYRDVDGDGDIDDNDKIYAGSFQPKCFFGFNLGLNYKGLDLSANFYGNAGNKIYNGKKAYRFDPADNIEADYARNRWTTTNPSSTDPRLITSSTPASTYFVESGTYLRLNNLMLGYTLPEKSLKAIGISSFRVYLTSQNLFTLKKYSGFSPELPGGTVDDANATNNKSGILDAGIELNAYPTTRTFALGVNVSF
jgi:TonB-linked SusC/RagA family outer membrane protein